MHTVMNLLIAMQSMHTVMNLLIAMQSMHTVLNLLITMQSMHVPMTWKKLQSLHVFWFFVIYLYPIKESQPGKISTIEKSVHITQCFVLLLDTITMILAR